MVAEVCALRFPRDQHWSSRCRCYLAVDHVDEHECICGGRIDVRSDR